MEIDKAMNGSNPLRFKEQSGQTERMKPSTHSSTLKPGNNPIKTEKELINPKELDSTLSKLNELIEPLQTNLKFEFHEKLEEYYVTIINPDTHEVIKEIPPKKLLDMYATMAEFMGLIVDRKI